MLALVFSIFFLATRHFYSNVNDDSPLKKASIVIIGSTIFSLFFVGYTRLTGLLKTEGFKFSHTPNKCK
jgi:hypothetical protein